MNPVDHQESTCKDDEEKVVASSSPETEPGHLLDESWFFGNLLIHTKPRMSRCYSDPSPSSSSSVNYSTEDLMMQPPGKSLEETFSLLQKLPAAAAADAENSAALVRAPSLPEESSSSSLSSAAGGRRKRSQRRRLLQRGNSYSTTTPPTPPPIPVSSANNLLSRAPSLPSSIGRRREEIQDDESDFSMSRLIRQASLKQSDILPRRNPPVPIPKLQLHQGVKQQGAAAATTTMSSRPRKPETERSIPENPEGIIKRQHPVLTGGNKLRKSSSDLVFQELQGLSIKFDKTDVQSGPNIDRDRDHKIPNTQGGVEEKYSMRRRSQLQKQLSMDTGNNNNNKKSVEDMKAQIKFWARAVASNVRQEC